MSNLNYEPISAEFGAEVFDIDLSQPMSDELLVRLKALYFEYSMLLFRHQNLTPADQAGFAHRFGRPKIESRKQYNLIDHPEVSAIGNATDSSGNPTAFFVRGGFGWHTDGTSSCHVDAATFLYAVDVPRAGGDTLFCSTVTGYQRAPRELLQKLEGVKMLCSFHAHNDPLYEIDPDAFIPLTPDERAALPEVWHDIIQRHPVTGHKVLYLYHSPIEFSGIGYEEGQRCVEEAFAICSADEHVYRHQWSPGELILWDNHAMLHSGTPTDMYEQDRRLMHRSFVFTEPTERPLKNLDEINRIFMPTPG